MSATFRRYPSTSVKLTMALERARWASPIDKVDLIHGSIHESGFFISAI